MFKRYLLSIFASPMWNKDDGKGGGSNNNDGTEDDDLDNIDLASLLDGEDDEDDEDQDGDGEEEKDGEDSEESKTGDKTKNGKPVEKTFTQEEVNQIIQDRLARQKQDEQQTAQRQQAEAEQKDKIKQWATERFEFYKKDLMDAYGLDEEAAERKAKDEVSKEYKTWLLEQRVEQLSKFPQETEATGKYSKERAEAMQKNPWVKQYIEEIDLIAGDGRNLTFELAAQVVLGKKVMTGELTQKAMDAATQETLKNVNRRKNLKVESGDQGGDKSGADGKYGLSKDELRAAKLLGVSPKEYAANKPKVGKSRRK